MYGSSEWATVVVQAYRTKFVQHLTNVHAAFWGHTLKFGTRVL